MKSLSTLRFIGVSLAVVGSFLPWEVEGDFVSYWKYGIQLFPVVRDYGGTLVVLLTSMIVLLSFYPPRFIKNPNLWNLVISVLLISASLFFIIRWLIHRIESAGIIGAATLEIGLIVVVLGSALLLWIAIIDYRRVVIHPTKGAG